MRTLVSLIAVALISGCALYTPTGAVVLGSQGAAPQSSGGGGGFCPPGQAKKGRC